MPNIDIDISADLREFLTLPPCVALTPPTPLKVTLPGGGTLKAFSDLSKGFPTDCSLTFSLLLQLAPFLASIECLVKVLKLVKTVVDILKGFTMPTDLISAIPKIVQAAAPVVECAVSFVAPVEFIRDLLCLLIKVLNCFLGQMKTLIGILGGISLKISAAQAAGNGELLAALQCAQANALSQAGQLTASIEPLGVILELAGDLMKLVGVGPIQLPALGSPGDVAALNQIVQTMQGVVAALQAAADTLGGCQ